LVAGEDGVMTGPVECVPRKLTMTIPVTGAQMEKASLIDVLTPQARAEYERRAAERAEILAAARERLAAITDPVARAVLDLHAPDDDGDCMGDDMEGYEAEQPTWPCRTVEAVAGHYGIRLKAP